MTKLLIGCGGAGLKTMYEHCKRLAKSKNRDSEKYYYIGIDTDREALGVFVNSTKRLNNGHFE